MFAATTPISVHVVAGIRVLINIQFRAYSQRTSRTLLNLDEWMENLSPSPNARWYGLTQMYHLLGEYWTCTHLHLIIMHLKWLIIALAFSRLIPEHRGTGQSIPKPRLTIALSCHMITGIHCWCSVQLGFNVLVHRVTFCLILDRGDDLRLLIDHNYKISLTVGWFSKMSHVWWVLVKS